MSSHEDPPFKKKGKGELTEKNSPNKIKETVEPFIKKFDEKLEDMLDEFDNYDYTYKPLLTQSEFEDEFLSIILKLFRRKNKYELVAYLFGEMVTVSKNDLHKLLCLIDFMINISRYDPAVFKKLPNEIVSKIVNEKIFGRIKQYLYNKGRMNYQFKNFNRARGSTPDLQEPGSESTANLGSASLSLEKKDAGSNAVSDDEQTRKVIDVSLAELTKKIMSKTKQPEHTENGPIKKEDAEGDQILSDSYNSEEDTASKSDRALEDATFTPRKSTIAKKKDMKSKLEKLVESSSSEEYSGLEDEDDEYNQNELDDDDNRSYAGANSMRSTYKLTIRKNRDSTENNSEEIPTIDVGDSTHPFDFVVKDLGGLKNINRQKPRFGKERSGIRENDQPVNYFNGAKIRPEKRRKISKNTFVSGRKVVLPEPPVMPKLKTIRKTYYVVETNLSFLFRELEHRFPKCEITLQKGKVKGFTYKPAQYNLFTHLTDETTNMDQEVRQYADDLLNTFLFQFSKKCGGNTHDPTQYVHPFEYDYIMENLDELKKVADKLPPIIFSNRFNSLFDYDQNTNANIDVLQIKNTKVKGLLRLKPFKSEEEYFEMFKKIVPRDKVPSRIQFLNNLVTDGESIYVFDILDKIMETLVAKPELLVDSDVEEARLLEEHNKIVNALKEEHRIAVAKALGVSNIKSDIAENTPATEKVPKEVTTTENFEKKIEGSTGPDNGISLVPLQITTNTEANVLVAKNPDVINSEKNVLKAGTNKSTPDITTGTTAIAPNPIFENNTTDESTNFSILNSSLSKSATIPTKVTSVMNTNDEIGHKDTDTNNLNYDHSKFAKIENISELHTAEAKETVRQSLNKKLNSDILIQDDREAVYCSSKGVHIPTVTIRKVLSSQEIFKMFAIILFPHLKLDSAFKGWGLNFIQNISRIYDGFRPYLLSLFADDVIEFIRLPRFFKVDSTMFELQIQYLTEKAFKKHKQT